MLSVNIRYIYYMYVFHETKWNSNQGNKKGIVWRADIMLKIVQSFIFIYFFKKKTPTETYIRGIYSKWWEIDAGSWATRNSFASLFFIAA